MWVTTIGPHCLHVAAGKKKNSFRLKRKKNFLCTLQWHFWRCADLQSYHGICTGAGSTHTWRATERRLHFDSPTRTRVNSDSSVNDGYCFRLFSVDTSPSTYFSPFPSRTLPRSTRTMTDSGQLRSSISLLGNHAEFLLSRSASALNTLQASHAL